MAKKKRVKRETVRGLSVDPAALDLAWLTVPDPAEDAAAESDQERPPEAE